MSDVGGRPSAARAGLWLPAGRRRGFSMIEIMAVLVILGVMLLAIAPSIDGLVPKYRLRGGAREVAALVEEAQGQAVSNRKEYVLVYDLDDQSFWLVLPPRDPDEGREGGAGAGPLGGLFGGGDPKEEPSRPRDDAEHGLPPPDPDAPAPQVESVAERDAITPRKLPTDVVFAAVIVGEDERRSGRVEVPFNHTGADGSHVVGVKLDRGGDLQIWVKFDALTRTIEYLDEPPTVRTLSGEGS